MADPVTRQNLEAAIGRELQARGLSPAAGDAKPSLFVSYFADVYQAADKNRPDLRGRRVGRTSNGRESSSSTSSPRPISRSSGVARHGRAIRT